MYWRPFMLAAMALALAVLPGCGGGDDDETNVPATRLTATLPTASSQVNAHTHTVTIPFSDLGSSAAKNYRSSDTLAHSHVIALSPQQFADLNVGMRVVVTSTAADGHTHTWEIRGGDVLYDSMCYNCHTNDKRGSRGMSSIPSQNSQRDAIQNPAGAPLSTAPPATPDPNFNAAPGTSTDGTALYASNCAGCHGPVATSSVRGRTAAAISSAISANRGGMRTLSNLTSLQIEAIANTLK